MTAQRAAALAGDYDRDPLDAGTRYRRDPGWIVVRAATANDGSLLERLAALDSADAPTGSTLIGELLGRPVAALSLANGRVLADPFVATEDVVAMLRLRARQLGADGRTRLMKRLLGRGWGWVRPKQRR